jgi:hypothetical protein
MVSAEIYRLPAMSDSGETQIVTTVDWQFITLSSSIEKAIPRREHV